jgi:alpha-L-fucosidase
MRIRYYLAALGLALFFTASSALGQKYEPNWESIDKRPIPIWFNAARFGVMVCWGPYCVPSYAPKGEYAEWYWNRVRSGKGPFYDFHRKNYGADFDYHRFGPMMGGELFNPDDWADLFAESGAKYVVMAANYHDGFCLWPSPYSPGWNAKETGPRRDVLGEVTAAVRKRGIKMGIYYSLYEWYHPLWQSDRTRYVNEHFLPQIKDVVTKYSPAFIFADGDWDMPDFRKWRSDEFLAWLYNQSPCKNDVVVNDRWGGVRGKHGDVYESEYGGGNFPPTHAWQEDRGMGSSYGYNRNEDVRDYNTRGQLLQMLAKCAGNGGNLLLNVGPTADGRIPVIMQERLLQIGQWLKVNRDAIYGTQHSPFWPRSFTWGACTQRPGKIFLHLYGNRRSEILLPGLCNEVKRAYWLADSARAVALKRADNGGIALNLPEHLPDPDVSVIVLEIEGPPRVDLSIRPQADGKIVLRAAEATIHGDSPRYESDGGKDNIGYWHNPKDYVDWEFKSQKPGVYRVEIVYSCQAGAEGSEFAVAMGDQLLSGRSNSTGDWSKFTTEELGTLKLGKSGNYTLAVRPKAEPKWRVIGLQAVILTPLEQ